MTRARTHSRCKLWSKTAGSQACRCRSLQQHYAFRVKCHSGLGSRTNMQSATPAPDASSTPLEGNKCHCPWTGNRWIRAQDLQEPILTSKPCLPSSGGRESFQLLILATLAPPQGTGHWGWGVGVADTGRDARTLSL